MSAVLWRTVLNRRIKHKANNTEERDETSFKCRHYSGLMEGANETGFSNAKRWKSPELLGFFQMQICTKHLKQAIWPREKNLVSDVFKITWRNMRRLNAQASDWSLTYDPSRSPYTWESSDRSFLLHCNVQIKECRAGLIGWRDVGVALRSVCGWAWGAGLQCTEWRLTLRWKIKLD